MLYDVDNSSGGALGEITDIQVMEGAKLAEYDDGTMEMTPVAVSYTHLGEGQRQG